MLHEQQFCKSARKTIRESIDSSFNPYRFAHLFSRFGAGFSSPRPFISARVANKNWPLSQRRYTTKNTTEWRTNEAKKKYGWRWLAQGGWSELSAPSAATERPPRQRPPTRWDGLKSSSRFYWWISGVPSWGQALPFFVWRRSSRAFIYL